ncbi:MAG: HAD-IA family hydrolase [Spirochaetaceae bacterium]
MAQRLAVLFDFDGTIADSIEAVQHATNDALRERGLPSTDDAGILYGMQFETTERFAYHSGRKEPELLEALKEEFYFYLSERSELVKEYEGALDVVRELRALGIATGIVSNNSSRLIHTVLNRWQAKELFDVVLGEDDIYPRKPDPAGLFRALERLEVAPLAAAYVGDSDSDAKAAREAGVYSVGVNWSHRNYGLTPAAWFPRNVETIDELRKRLLWWKSLVENLPERVVRGEVRKRLFVMRHCESEANRLDIVAAREEFPLSSRGRKQAERIAERFLQTEEIDRIISSPLSRARQTAKPFAEKRGVVVEINEALVEHELGVFSGLSKREIAERRDYPREKEGRWRWRPEGGETYEEIYERVVAFLLRDVIAGPGESILITSHAVTMRMIRAFLENSAPLYPEEIAENGEIWEIHFSAVGRPHPIREHLPAGG